MNLYLATSCLIGLPDDEVIETLLGFTPYGIQLCAGFGGVIADIPTRTHHGYTPGEWRTKVWDGHELKWRGDSIHPPKRDVERFGRWCFDHGVYEDVALETMYPGYWLGTGEELEIAMTNNQRLAVDISHIWIQRQAGVIDDSTISRLCEYGNVAEVHVSANNGRHDTHSPIRGNEMMLEWALGLGVPVILECNMQRMTPAQRQQQVDTLLGLGAPKPEHS